MRQHTLGFMPAGLPHQAFSRVAKTPFPILPARMKQALDVVT